MTNGTDQTLDEAAEPARGAGFRWSAAHRFGALLLFIVAAMCFQLAAPDNEWARFVNIVLLSATLLLAVRVGRTRARLIRIATIGVSVVVAGAAIMLLAPGEVSTWMPAAVTLALVLLAPPAIVTGIVEDMRDSGGVTLQTMFGALSTYLLIAIAFSLAFGIIDSLESMPFFTSGGDNEPADFLYFSVVTETTLGYGDLAPATSLGRAFTVAEALIGQIYLVTIIAIVVSNLATRGRERVQQERRQRA